MLVFKAVRMCTGRLFHAFGVTTLLCAICINHGTSANWCPLRSWTRLLAPVVQFYINWQCHPSTLYLFSSYPLPFCVVWWCNGYGVGLAIERSQVRFQAIPPSGNDSGQVVHTHVPVSPSSIIWYQPKHWESKDSVWERCGLLAQGHVNGDEHQP